MKCPACGYVSFDYLDACRRCHADWVEYKRRLGLKAYKPGDLDLSVVLQKAAADEEAAAFTTQLVDPEALAAWDDEAVDVYLDDAASETSPAAPKQPAAPPPTPPQEVPPLSEEAALPPLEMIDMSDLAEADEEISLAEPPAAPGEPGGPPETAAPPEARPPALVEPPEALPELELVLEEEAPPASPPPLLEAEEEVEAELLIDFDDLELEDEEGSEPGPQGRRP